MKKLLSFLLILVFLLCSTAFGAGDIYIATDGTDDAGCGAIGDPCAGIQYSIDNKITDALGGWNLILRQGTYLEHDINIPVTKTATSGAWNTMRSYPGEWAILNGERSCVEAARSVIRNGGNTGGSDRAEDYAQHWLFERMEIMGGGNTTGGNTAGGIWWVFGPATIRFCYIHDNLSETQNENPSGVNGQMQRLMTIEYNSFYNNGTTGAKFGNDRNISTQTLEQCCYVAEPNLDDLVANAVRDNIIRYNYIDANGGSIGIGMKASNRLVQNIDGVRDVTDYTYRENGDKIHHNITINTVFAGIVWQSDWTQIYKNIVESTSTNSGYGAITTRRDGSEGVDTIYPCVYNNLTRGPSAGFNDDADGKFFQKFQLYLVNNIFDQSNEAYNSYPITMYHASSGGPAGWYGSYVWPTSFDITDVLCDRNYIYRSAASTGNDIIQGKVSGTYNYTYTEFETAFNVDIYLQATQEAGANKLFVGTTGADRFITVGTHNVGETSKTIANTGGGTHPYLTGVNIPVYTGPVNPDDIVVHNWVAGVLAQTADIFKDLVNGSIPLWTEAEATNPIVTLPADFESTNPASFQGTATTTSGVITDIVSTGGNVTIDSGAGTNIVGFTVSSVPVPSTPTVTATNTGAEEGFDSITITLPSPVTSVGRIGGAIVNGNFR